MPRSLRALSLALAVAAAAPNAALAAPDRDFAGSQTPAPKQRAG